MRAEDLSAIGVSLTRAGKPLLFLRVEKDGRVGRLGNGTTDPVRDYVSADAPPEGFSTVCGLLSAELLARHGRFVLPDRAGDEMLLSIRLTAGRMEQVLELTYGADSAPPPHDVQRFVSTAVALTDDWYAAHLPPSA